MPVTQAAISTFFGDGKEDRSKPGEKEIETKSLEAVIRAVETKMRQMVTPEYLEKEFKKMITDDLSKKLVKLRDDLKKHFQEELAKVNHRVAELEAKIKDNKTEIESLKNDRSDLQTKVQKLEEKYKNLKTEKDNLADKVSETEQIVKRNVMHLNDIEQYTRRNNIRIYGVDDSNKDETAEETVGEVLKLLDRDLNLSLHPRDINIAHRIGQFQKDGNRVIICSFVSRTHRNEVIRRRKLLKGKVQVIREDLTRKNAKLLEEVSDVSNVSNAWSDQGKIIAKLDTNEKMLVTLATDLKIPLVPPPKKTFPGRKSTSTAANPDTADATEKI